MRHLLVALGKIAAEYDEGGRGGLLMRLLVAEIGSVPMIPRAIPFTRHPALAALCHAVLDHPRTRASIDGWACPLAISRRTFTRLIRRETGMSFAERRQQACFAVALPRLAAGEPITTFVLNLDYDGPANSSTMFKCVLDAPLSHYRVQPAE